MGILVCASIPNPLFDLAGITCGHFLVPFWTFFGQFNTIYTFWFLSRQFSVSFTQFTLAGSFLDNFRSVLQYFLFCAYLDIFRSVLHNLHFLVLFWKFFGQFNIIYAFLCLSGHFPVSFTQFTLSGFFLDIFSSALHSLPFLVLFLIFFGQFKISSLHLKVLN